MDRKPEKGRREKRNLMLNVHQMKMDPVYGIRCTAAYFVTKWMPNFPDIWSRNIQTRLKSPNSLASQRDLGKEDFY